MRLALVCDFVEEKWPSMDLVADMLLENLCSKSHSGLQVTRVRPRMVWRFSRLPGFGGKRKAYAVDRLLNRFWDYPRHLARRRQEQFDLYHIIDHSYGHLVHQLPSERTIVNCYDIDTFRCLVEPKQEPRSKIFMIMTARILSGLRRAARVSCASAATRSEILKYRILPPERVVVIPQCVHRAFTPQADRYFDGEAARLLGPANANAIDILHVGSNAARKRIDVLLRVTAAVRQDFPQARLTRVGTAFSRSQQELAESLNLAESLVVLPFVERQLLAAVYRRAALVMQPSEREGVGLPVMEAMACGTPVVASDLPALRETGGPSATYCPVGDVPPWTDAVVELLRERNERPRRWNERRLAAIAWAARFNTREYTRKTVQMYEEVLCERQCDYTFDNIIRPRVQHM